MKHISILSFITVFSLISFDKLLAQLLYGSTSVCPNTIQNYYPSCEVGQYRYTISKELKVIITGGTYQQSYLGSEYQYASNNRSIDIDFTGVPAGEYNVKYETLSNTTCTGSLRVRVYPTPTEPKIPSTLLCEDLSVDLADNFPEQIVAFYSTDVSATAIDSKISFPNPGKFTYFVTNNDGGCISKRVPYDVTVLTRPVATVRDTTICAEQPLDLTTRVKGGTIKWFESLNSTTPIPTPAIPSEAGNYTYFASVTENTCEGAKSSFLVKINPRPISPIVSQTTFNRCVETSATPISANGTNIKWYDYLLNVVASGANYTIPAPVSERTSIYYASQTNANNCESQRATITVNDNAKPLPPSVVNATYCQNSTSVGSGFFWYKSATASDTVYAAPPTLKPGITPYYVSQKVKGCESNRTRVNITTKPVTESPIDSVFEYCLNNVNGRGYKWYKTVSDTASKPTPDNIIGDKVTYYITSTETGLCESRRKKALVTVSKPLPPVLSSYDVKYCQHQAADTVKSLLTQPGSYSWFDSPTLSSTPKTFLPDTRNPDTTEYYVSQRSDKGCISDRSKLTVTIISTPRLKTNDLTINELTSGDLTKAFSDSNKTDGIVTYWNDANATSSQIAISEASRIPNPGVFYIKKTVGTCSDIKPVKIIDSNLPLQIITFPAIENKVYGDKPFKLKATSDKNLPITYISLTPSVLSIKGDSATIINAGTAKVVAIQNGNTTVNPASNVEVQIIIAKSPQSITVAPIGNKNIGDPAFAIVATATSKLNTFAYTVVDGSATIVGDKVTLSKTTSGQVSIKITQAGNNNYLAKDTTITFTVKSRAILSMTFREFLELTETSGITLKLKSDIVRNEVKFYYKSINASKFDSVVVDSTGLDYKPDLTRLFNESGIEFYFKIRYNSTQIEYTIPNYTYVKYPSGLNYKLLGSTKQEDYKIISIPLNLAKNKVGEVLNGLIPYDRKKWRMWQFKDAANMELSEADTLVPGKGYWILSKNTTDINTGDGTAVKFNNKNPYLIKLKRGWNMIGNPYNFPISWNQVYFDNNSPKEVENKIHTYSSTGYTFKNDILPAKEGGFVYTDSDFTLRVYPGAFKKIGNQRESSEGWLVDFTLTDNSGYTGLGGIGMNSNASLGRDNYDAVSSPRFVRYSEINFNHSDQLYKTLSYDVIPESENHEWSMSLESNSEESNLNLTWSPVSNTSKDLYLFDQSTGIAINMKERQHYTISNSNKTDLKVFYGDRDYVASRLVPNVSVLHNPFPNPASENTTISYALAESGDSYSIELSILNAQMKTISLLEKTEKASGFYSSNWDVSNLNLTAGLYFVKLRIMGKTNKEIVKKIIVK